MTEHETTPIHEESVYLPPVRYQLLDPRKYKIETPLTNDDRQLIDIPQLIQDVQETVDPEYLWPRTLGVHHFYWPEANYPREKKEGPVRNPHVFYDLPIHKGLVPRVFENWLHAITLPPPTPDPEVMRYRVESWIVARSLFDSFRGSKQWERKAVRRAAYTRENPTVLRPEFNGRDIIAEEIIQETLESYFKGAKRQMERLERIPSDFRLFDPNQPRQILAQQLGQMIMPKKLHNLIPRERLELVS